MTARLRDGCPPPEPPWPELERWADELAEAKITRPVPRITLQGVTAVIDAAVVAVPR